MAQELLLTRNIHRERSESIDVYLQHGGYESLRKVLKGTTPSPR